VAGLTVRLASIDQALERIGYELFAFGGGAGPLDVFEHTAMRFSELLVPVGTGPSYGQTAKLAHLRFPFLVSVSPTIIGAAEAGRNR
jgi:hypothetical protein